MSIALLDLGRGAPLPFRRRDDGAGCRNSIPSAGIDLRGQRDDDKDLGYYWTMVGDLARIKVVHEAFTPSKDELINWSDLDWLATEAEKTNSLITFTPIPTSSWAASSPWPTWQGSQEPRLGHGSLGLVK